MTTELRDVIVMDVLSNSVLVLNASYEAINVCSAKRALVLVCKGAAIVQEKSVHVLRTPTFNLPLPAVIRLLTYRAVPRRLHAVSRKGIMVRDGFTWFPYRSLRQGRREQPVRLAASIPVR